MKKYPKTIETIDQCAKLLIAQGLTLGFGESATCGHIASQFSLSNDAGRFLKGAIACYDAGIKESLLQVDKGLIEQYTPESAEVTKALTEGIAPLLQADICIGCTGLTCPGGSETIEKPVGTMFLHGSCNGQTIFADRTVFSGDRQQIIEKTTDRAAHLLLYFLQHRKDFQAEKETDPKNAKGFDQWSVSWP